VSMHVCRVRRLRTIDWRETARSLCPTIAGGGWQAVCRCGWHGEYRSHRSEAQDDVRRHVSERRLAEPALFDLPRIPDA
jgi:hypothetical protein